MWPALARRYAELSGRAGASDLRTAGRLKQWLRLANHDGRLPWFDALKALHTTHDLLRRLAELAAAGAPRRSA